MSKVLVVTSGSYSDYHIVAVFLEEHRAMAEAFCAAGAGDIEEYELATWTPEQGAHTFYFDWHGNLTNETYTPCTETESPYPELSVSFRYGGNGLEITVYRGIRDQALKIASEKRVRFMAALDQARELGARAGIADDWCVCQIANILAGFCQPPPDTDQSHYAKGLRRALSVAGCKPTLETSARSGAERAPDAAADKKES